MIHLDVDLKRSKFVCCLVAVYCSLFHLVFVVFDTLFFVVVEENDFPHFDVIELHST